LVRRASSIVVWLLPRVLELTLYRLDLEPFAQDCGWPGPPFRWDEERRFLLRCELDAAFFHLYLPAEESGAWRPADGETAADLARLKPASRRRATPWPLSWTPSPSSAVGTRQSSTATTAQCTPIGFGTRDVELVTR